MVFSVALRPGFINACPSSPARFEMNSCRQVRSQSPRGTSLQYGDLKMIPAGTVVDTQGSIKQRYRKTSWILRSYRKSVINVVWRYLVEVFHSSVWQKYLYIALNTNKMHC